MVSFEHKLCTWLLGFIAKEKGFKFELEPDTVTGVKPDARFTHKNCFPIHLEYQSKGTGYEEKKEKAEKAHAKLLFLDGSKFDFDEVSMNALMNHLEFAFEQAMQKAMAPIRQLKFQKEWPWLKEMKIGDIFITPRRMRRYRKYYSEIGELYWITPLVEKGTAKTYKDTGICKNTDVWKEPIDNLKKFYNGKVWLEYAESVHRHEKDKEKDKIVLLKYEIVEVF